MLGDESPSLGLRLSPDNSPKTFQPLAENSKQGGKFHRGNFLGQLGGGVAPHALTPPTPSCKPAGPADFLSGE